MWVGLYLPKSQVCRSNCTDKHDINTDSGSECCNDDKQIKGRLGRKNFSLVFENQTSKQDDPLTAILQLLPDARLEVLGPDTVVPSMANCTQPTAGSLDGIIFIAENLSDDWFTKYPHQQLGGQIVQTGRVSHLFSCSRPCRSGRIASYYANELYVYCRCIYLMICALSGDSSMGIRKKWCRKCQAFEDQVTVKSGSRKIEDCTLIITYLNWTESVRPQVLRKFPPCAACRTKLCNQMLSFIKTVNTAVYRLVFWNFHLLLQFACILSEMASTLMILLLNKLNVNDD